MRLVSNILKDKTMNISALNSSAVEFRDSLTSPFILKKVTINAHTPCDEVPVLPQEETLSRTDFYPRQYPTSKLGISSGLSNKELVQNSISGGLSATEAVQVYKAHRAYGMSSLGNQAGVSLLANNVEA